MLRAALLLLCFSPSVLAQKPSPSPDPVQKPEGRSGRFAPYSMGVSLVRVDPVGGFGAEVEGARIGGEALAARHFSSSLVLGMSLEVTYVGSQVRDELQDSGRYETVSTTTLLFGAGPFVRHQADRYDDVKGSGA